MRLEESIRSNRFFDEQLFHPCSSIKNNIFLISSLSLCSISIDEVLVQSINRNFYLKMFKSITYLFFSGMRSLKKALLRAAFSEYDSIRP